MTSLLRSLGSRGNMQHATPDSSPAMDATARVLIGNGSTGIKLPPSDCTPTAKTRGDARNDVPVPGAERVKVVLRVRPALRDDETSGALKLDTEGGRLTLHRPDAAVQHSDFAFDKVLGPDATQLDVYNAAVRDVVDDVLKGYNGTVLAYGQTGAGKTYTLGNTQRSSIGMIPRAVAEVFRKAEEDPFHDYVISMSYIQIYMELLQDLLNPASDNLVIREDVNSGVFVAGTHDVPIKSLEECLHYLELGERNRVFAFTHLNAHSSRSHVVTMVTVVKSRKYLTPAEKQEIKRAERDGMVTQKVKVGKLYLVDLAGSERLKKSRSVGLRATEAKSINLSLTCLGMCINARANDQSHVPFRESKLTRLLQESLGGNAKTTMLLCACDVAEHAEETLQSLQFGSRAMRVCNRPQVNERLDYKVLSAELQGNLDATAAQQHHVEVALYKTEEERDALQAKLEEEKVHFSGILEQLKREAAQSVLAAQAAAQAALEAQRLKAQQVHSELDSRHSAAQQALEQQRGVLQSREQALHEAQAQGAQREEVIQAMQAAAMRMEGEHQAVVFSLKEELERLQAEHHTELAAQRERSTKLTANLSESQAAALSASTALTALTAMHAALAAELNTLQAAHTLLQACSEKQAASLVKAEQAHRELNSRHSVAQQALEEQQGLLQSREQALHEAQVQGAQREEAIGAMQVEAQRTSDEHQATMSHMTEEMQAMQAKHLSQAAAQQSRLHELTADLAAAQAENLTLVAATAEMTASHAAVSSDHRQLQGAHQRLATGNEELQAAISRLEAGKAQLLAREAQLEGEKAQLEGDKAQLEGDKAQLEGDKAQLEGDKAQLEATNWQLCADGQALRSGLAQAEAINEDLRGDLSAMYANQHSLHAALAGLQQAAGALVPLGGAAAPPSRPGASAVPGPILSLVAPQTTISPGAVGEGGTAEPAAQHQHWLPAASCGPSPCESPTLAQLNERAAVASRAGRNSSVVTQSANPAFGTRISVDGPVNIADLEVQVAALHTMLQDAQALQALLRANGTAAAQEVVAMQARLTSLQAALSAQAADSQALMHQLAERSKELEQCSEQLGTSQQHVEELRALINEQQTALELERSDRHAASEQEQQRRQQQARVRNLEECVRVAQQALERRLITERRVKAAITIQASFRRWRTYLLKLQTAADGQELDELHQRHHNIHRAAQLQAAQMGASMVAQSLDVIRGAVDSVMAAFLMPGKDLAAHRRVQQLSPMGRMASHSERTPSPGIMDGARSLRSFRTLVRIDPLAAAASPPPHGNRSTSGGGSGKTASAPGTPGAVRERAGYFSTPQRAAAAPPSAPCPSRPASMPPLWTPPLGVRPSLARNSNGAGTAPLPFESSAVYDE